MSDRTKIQRKKADTSTVTNPSLASPNSPTLAYSNSIGQHNITPPQTLPGISTNIQETQFVGEQVLEAEAIQQKPLGHDISKISLRPQAGLTVSQRNDPYEQEADRVAEQVMNATATETQHLQRSADGNFDTSADLENQLNASKGSASPLPENVQAFMEQRFGADFSSVRVHTDSTAIQMNRDLGAQAFTYGSDIYFGAGKSPGNNELTAHELTHVVQQGGETQVQQSIKAKLTISSPKDAAEQEADAVAHRVLGGEKVTVGQTTTADIHGDWASDAWNGLGDAFDMRDNEAALDEWEDYQASTAEMLKFVSNTHRAENFQSTTRLGMFDAIYNPSGTLQIVCKCKFNFVSGNATEFPNATPEQLAWTDQAEMDAWKAKFISTVSSTWSSGNHIFYCQKPWWESLIAKVSVDIQEADSGEHFALSIAKIPKGEFRTSSVSSPTVLPIIGQTTGGTGDFDSEDLETVSKPGGMQTPAVHEAGHMLGLDDEYGTGTPSHSDLVESEFGHGVARGSDGRIMSGGNDIQPEHGVTFLEALKEATGISQWTATMCPVPRPVPANPNASPPGDYPLPKSDTVPV
jgi:Zn-dependent peptidase ImmA (M78 family)